MIPNVLELKTLKEMIDSLTIIYEIKNTIRNPTLRNQLKNMKMNKSETISNYFMRISPIKDQLTTIGDLVDNVELMNNTLNGFPSSWDPCFQWICARRKLPNFDMLWLYCTQEYSKIISKSQNTNDNEYQALSAHLTKKESEKRIHFEEI
jgi:hypothetical protein